MIEIPDLDQLSLDASVEKPRSTVADQSSHLFDHIDDPQSLHDPASNPTSDLKVSIGNSKESLGNSSGLNHLLPLLLGQYHSDLSHLPTPDLHRLNNNAIADLNGLQKKQQPTIGDLLQTSNQITNQVTNQNQIQPVNQNQNHYHSDRQNVYLKPNGTLLYDNIHLNNMLADSYIQDLKAYRFGGASPASATSGTPVDFSMDPSKLSHQSIDEYASLPVSHGHYYNDLQSFFGPSQENVLLVGGGVSKTRNGTTSLLSKLQSAVDIEDEEVVKDAEIREQAGPEVHPVYEQVKGLGVKAPELSNDPSQLTHISQITQMGLDAYTSSISPINNSPSSTHLEPAPSFISPALSTSLLREQPTYAGVDQTPMIQQNTISMDEGILPNGLNGNYTAMRHLDALLPLELESHLMLNGKKLSLIRKSLATDEKLPAEYTLHILFTQFVRHAERKLNLCLDYPLNEEPPVIDLLAEGVDVQFDKILALLGYIARKKPSPVIDSVMFWRKSKSEVASMAAQEVERVMQMARAANYQALAPQIPSTEYSNVGLSPVSIGKAKRSLSLMRTKSFSKLSHRRAVSSSTVSQSTSSTLTASSTIGAQNGGLTLEDTKVKELEFRILQARETAVQADRKSLASIYILCRVLLEVVRQAPQEVIGGDLGVKLEEIVYTQLKTTDPISTSELLVRLANWNLFAQLLGIMLEKRFIPVSDRFIADLEKVPAHISNPNDEPRLHLLIHGMKYLKLSNFPLEKFEESADFMQLIGKFFSKAQNDLVVFAYCDVIGNLVLTLAGNLTAEVNHPTWVESVRTIYEKGKKLGHRLESSLNSSKDASAISEICWQHCVLLLSSILSVAPKELFSEHWMDFIESNLYKLKLKVPVEDRVTFVVAVNRLLWVYLYRLPDSLNNTVKKLDTIFAHLLLNQATKKQQWVSVDPHLFAAILNLFRIIGYQHLNYVLDNALLPLIKQLFNGNNLEGSITERLILAVKAYLIVLQGYETGERPLFPADENETLQELQLLETKDFKAKAKSNTNAALHDEICRIFSNILKLLDEQYGVKVNSDTSEPVTSSKSTFFHFDFTDLGTKGLHLVLFGTLLEALPWTEETSSQLPFKNLVEILVRNAVHPDFSISQAANKALRKLAARRNCCALLSVFAKIAFQFQEKPTFAINPGFILTNEFRKFLKIYVELLNVWLNTFRKSKSTGSATTKLEGTGAMSDDVLNDLYQVNHEVSLPQRNQRDELEWKNIITAIEEIEGNGLFFLFSYDNKTRHYGLVVLKIVEQFDRAMSQEEASIPSVINPSDQFVHSRSSSKFAAEIGARLIHILDDADFLELIKPLKHLLSSAERSRLSKLKNKKHILSKLCELDYGIDLTLWFRLFPSILDIFFEKCPMPVALCRLIVCVRMVQMHESILDFANTNKTYTSLLFGRSNTNGPPPEVLVEQWKLYLIFAACSLTLTNEQKILFPVEPKGHGRKKSLQIYVQHQKITLAKLIFRMVFPLLSLKQLMVQNAVIVGLLCININIFRTLLENIPSAINEWEPQRKKRDPSEDQLRIEIIHILSNVTGKFRGRNDIYADEWTLENLVSIVKNVKAFLSLPFVQSDIVFQRLRRYFAVFLENVYDGISLVHGAKAEKWLPFEARLGCFNFLKEWCGYGDGAFEIAEERYQQMIRQQKTEIASVEAILEVERSALSQASLSCMLKLCSGSIRHEIDVGSGIPLAVLLFDIPALMSWIHGLFSLENESVHDLGRGALKCIIPQDTDIYREVVKQCYTEQKYVKTTESYFTVLTDVLMEHPSSFENDVPYDVLCLCMFLVGSESFEVRKLAVQLLVHLEKAQGLLVTSEKFTESACSRSSVVYKKAMFDISAAQASAASASVAAQAGGAASAASSVQPDGIFERISCFTMFYNLVGQNTKRDILSCLLPWMQIARLRRVHDGNDAPYDAGSLMVLSNLFELSVRFLNHTSNEVEALWVALGSVQGNFDEALNFVIKLSLEKKNSHFVEYSRQIIDYLLFAQVDRLYILSKLIENLNPRAMIPPAAATNFTFAGSDADGDSVYTYIADLLKVLPSHEKEVAFSIGQLSLVFLVDLIPNEIDHMKQALPLLLHVSFSLLDHYLTVVQEQAGMLLIQLIHTLAPNSPKSVRTINQLRQKDHIKHLWVYDDLNEKRGMSGGARTPKNMDSLVRNVLEIFSDIEQEKSLQETWSRVALNWATTCAVRHLACRLFQVFRLLLVELDQGMLKDMLHRLSNTISDEAVEIQGFAMQILMTLNALTAELDSKNLIDFPQLFWLSVACLSTVHEQEFIEALLTMQKFVLKIDLDAPDTVSCLISTFPPKWEGKFEGLQLVVIQGLRLGTAFEAVFRFLDQICTLKDSEVIGSGDSRLLMALLSNLPRFLRSLDTKNVEGISGAAEVLSQMADQEPKFLPLSKILISLLKNRFRLKRDFLIQTVTNIKNLFFPKYEAQTLVFLLGLSLNKIPWFKLEVLAILKEIMPLVNFQREEYVGVGADLILPLLRLLLTDYAEKALEVLDEAKVIPGLQLDKDVLRMSLGNTLIKKEYEKTAMLFGVPDESGWSVLMPAVTAASTRNNVHAVFATCAVAATAEAVKPDDDEEVIHFHMEDYYVPPEIQDVELVNVGEPDASLSNMWAALDDFDSFFTNHPLDAPPEQYGGVPSHSHSASVDTDETYEDFVVDSAPLVYDKKVSAILNRSLNRTQLNSLFKSSFGDPMAGGAQMNLARIPVDVNGNGMYKRLYMPFGRSSRISGSATSILRLGGRATANGSVATSVIGGSSTISGSTTPEPNTFNQHGFQHVRTLASPRLPTFELELRDNRLGESSPKLPPSTAAAGGGVLGLIELPFDLLGSNKKRAKRTSKLLMEGLVISNTSEWQASTPKSPTGMPKVRKEKKRVQKRTS